MKEKLEQLKKFNCIDINQIANSHEKFDMTNINKSFDTIFEEMNKIDMLKQSSNPNSSKNSVENNNLENSNTTDKISKLREKFFGTSKNSKDLKK